MNLALWVIAGLLATVYFAVGCVKLLRGEALEQRMPWVEAFPGVVVRLIGLCEIGGALGLILPQATGKLLWLTPAAAACLALLQMLAIVVHSRRTETQQLGINVVLLVLALVVAVGRFAEWTTANAGP